MFRQVEPRTFFTFYFLHRLTGQWTKIMDLNSRKYVFFGLHHQDTMTFFFNSAAAALSCVSLVVEAELMPGALRLLFWPQGEARPSHPLVEEHVRVGGQDLVQAGFADRVVRHPQPLGAVGWQAAGRLWTAAVCDKMSRVHVAVVNQHGRELEEVLRGAGMENDAIKINYLHQWNC